jgi:hypothetical protein
VANERDSTSNIECVCVRFGSGADSGLDLKVFCQHATSRTDGVEDLTSNLPL